MYVLEKRSIIYRTATPVIERFQSKWTTTTIEKDHQFYGSFTAFIPRSY